MDIADPVIRNYCLEQTHFLVLMLINQCKLVCLVGTHFWSSSHLTAWIVPQFFNLRPKMAKSIVYVITLITNRNHAFHCLN